MNEIVLKDADILNDDFSFASKIEVATNVATTLKRVLHEQNLVVKIKKNEYVLAEGWNTLGTILGTYAKTVEVVPFKSLNGKMGYKARVCIMKGENQLACAEAIDVPQKDHNGGLIRDESAMYSMAQTRAMGKAYRMAFSWIVKMAGFEPTPAEEMENIKNRRKGSRVKRQEEVHLNNTETVEAEIVREATPETFEKLIRGYKDVLGSKGLPLTRIRILKCLNTSETLDIDFKKALMDYVQENYDKNMRRKTEEEE